MKSHKSDKYSHLYCEKCKLIYAIGVIGQAKYCNNCGHLLTVKSFKPWYSVIGAAVLITIGLVTVFVVAIPIIWIGAFIWAIGLIVNAFRQWSKIKDLDNPHRSQYVAPSNPVKNELKDDSKHIVVNCGACSHQYRVSRGKGIIKTKCPSCGRESRIMT